MGVASNPGDATPTPPPLYKKNCSSSCGISLKKNKKLMWPRTVQAGNNFDYFKIKKKFFFDLKKLIRKKYKKKEKNITNPPVWLQFFEYKEKREFKFYY